LTGFLVVGKRFRNFPAVLGAITINQAAISNKVVVGAITNNGVQLTINNQQLKPTTNTQ
jgi:hypothetical protein